MDNKHSSIDFNDVILFLKINAIKISIILFIVLFLGALITINTKPVFKAEATIIIDSKRNKSNILGDTFGGFSNDKLLEDKIQILSSRNISRLAIDRLLSENEKLFIIGTKEYVPVGSYRKMLK